MDEETPYSVDIDFNEASQFWRENKKKVGRFLYYKCSHKNCKRNAIQLPLLKEFVCKWHSGLYYKNVAKPKYEL